MPVIHAGSAVVAEACMLVDFGVLAVRKRISVDTVVAADQLLTSQDRLLRA